MAGLLVGRLYVDDRKVGVFAGDSVACDRCRLRLARLEQLHIRGHARKQPVALCDAIDRNRLAWIDRFGRVGRFRRCSRKRRVEDLKVVRDRKTRNRRPERIRQRESRHTERGERSGFREGSRPLDDARLVDEETDEVLIGGLVGARDQQSYTEDRPGCERGPTGERRKHWNYLRNATTRPRCPGGPRDLNYRVIAGLTLRPR